MDRLQARIAREAADGAARGAPGEATFARVRDAVDPARVPRALPARAGVAPRLTEDWFC
jgi:hypothetical protein